MTNVRALPHVVDPAKPLEFQPVPEVVAKLADILAMAETGQLRSFVLAGVYYDTDGSECTLQSMSVQRGGHRLVASLVYAQHTLVGFMTEDSTPLDVPSPPESA